MKAIYLAAKYRRRHELIAYAKQLESLGYTVTSRWLNYHDDPTNAHVLTGDETEAERHHKRGAWGGIDLADLNAADTVVSFTQPEREVGDSRGGRHVEFGYALARDKAMVVIGHRENVFHNLPGVLFFETWDAFLATCGARVSGHAGR